MSRESEYYVDLCNRLLATKDYEWARDTLAGIAGTIGLSGVVTPNQKQAIDHIMVGRLKHDTGRGQ